MKRENAAKLIKEIDNKLNSWNERSQFKIKGIKNLSRADLDMLRIYAEQVLRTGNFSGLMKPMGNEKLVLEKFDLVDDRQGLYMW